MGGLGCVSEFIVQPSDGSESRRELSLDAHAFIPPSHCIRLRAASFDIHGGELQVAAAGVCSAGGVSEADPGSVCCAGWGPTGTDGWDPSQVAQP